MPSIYFLRDNSNVIGGLLPGSLQISLYIGNKSQNKVGILLTRIYESHSKMVINIIFGGA